MPETLIDGWGSGNLLAINADGSINISGVDISIGSLALALESVYVQSGTMYVSSGNIAVTGSVETFTVGASDSRYITSGNITVTQEVPTDTSTNNPAYEYLYITSGTTTGVTGSVIGSIIQFIGTGSYVQVLTYGNDLLETTGSWS